MLSIEIGTSIAVTVLSIFILFKNRKTMSTYLNWLLVHTKYNIIATKGIVLDQIQAKKNVTELPKMLGRVAIVTGGARGIGLEIVKMLLQCDMDVIIACRNLSAGHKAIETIKNSGINYSGKPKVMVLDNSKFKSVQKFVQDFKKDYTKLDILINNAGIMFTPYEETEDGFEQQYQVNYLSHFYLTLALIPLLNNAGTPELNSRIINVSSCAHLLGKINFDDFNYKQDFNTGEAYAQSKLAQLMFTKKLARLFESKNLPIKTHAVHPGVVNTDLFEHSFVKHLKVVTNLIFKTPKQGATSIVYAAVSPDLEKKNGLYLSNCLEYSYNPLANDCDKQDKLFDISLKQAHMQSFNL